MINNRLGAIFSEINNPPQNYATTILESLASLETTRNIFLNQNNPYMSQTLITNEFRNIINNVYSSENPISAMNLINYLNKYALNHNQDLNQCNNPYTFLYYFFLLLEEEYNNAFQINNNLNQEFPSIENASNYFKQIYDTPNISIISKNYCFSIVMTNFCNSCKTTKSKPMFKKTIDLNIDSYLQMNNSGSLSLNECLNYYFTPKQLQSNCQNCNNSKPFQARVILKSGPVLIINLMRNNYTGDRDPNFTINYNIDLSQYKKDKNEGNNNYRLKACISYSNFGFFTDCFMKRDDSNGEWFRYMNNQAIINRDTLFGFQPVLLFYESIDNQNNNNNINNMNININQNMNYNEQINQQNINLNMNQINNNINIQNNQNIIINENNENNFDIISNFPCNLNIAFGEQISNFDFNLNNNLNIINNPQSNVQMDNNFNNYQNQNNNNFGNISSQQQNQFIQSNQNNMNNNDNINNQNINNNNFEQNLNQLHNYDDEDEKGETDIQNINNDSNISNNPFFNANQNLEKNQNSNIQNNNFNMELSMQSNLNQNMNQNENINISNDINQNINKNEIPNFQNYSNQNNNNSNMIQNNSSNENQSNFSDQNQNIQNNMSNNNFNNEIKNEIQQNLSININNEQANQMKPNFQQSNFMPNNNISNDMSNNMNSQEEKIEIPQISSLSFPQEEMKNNINNQINDSPQSIPNSNIEIQHKYNNEIPQNLMNPINMNINPNQNNFNPNPQIEIPQNISNEINEIKNEQSNKINKELPKPENKIEQIKIEQKIELNKPPESHPEIKNNIQEKAKLFSGGIKLNHPQEKAIPKIKLSKDIFPKNEPKKQESKPLNFGGAKPNKFKDFKAMLEKKGGMFGAPRPSAQMMGMPHGFAGMMINKNDKGGQGPTFEENKDLVKKLDAIKVQKKKKKAKINFDDES